MKKLFSLVLVLLVAGCSVDKQVESSKPATDRNVNWINVASTKDRMNVDVDSGSIQPFGSLIAYRSRFRLPQPEKDGTSIIGYEQIMDCNSGTYKTTETVSLNQQGELVDINKTPKPSIENLEQGSVQEAVYHFVCQEPNIADSSGRAAPKSSTLTPSDIKMIEIAASMARRNMEMYWRDRETNAQFIAELARSASSLYNNSTSYYPCDYPGQVDSLGRYCGGRAASERPGGR